MTSQVHRDHELPEPAVRLLDETRRLAPGWLRRVTCAAAGRGGVDLADADPELAVVVQMAVDRLVDDLDELLATDVDRQRTNPLSLFRQAVAGPNELLLRREVRPRAADGFAATHFPGDVFGLGPASWSDVDPELHEPGITWGAWKAMTVLQRRRDDGHS